LHEANKEETKTNLAEHYLAEKQDETS